MELSYVMAKLYMVAAGVEEEFMAVAVEEVEMEAEADVEEEDVSLLPFVRLLYAFDEAYVTPPSFLRIFRQ